MCFGHRLAFTALGLPPFEPSFASLEPSRSGEDRCHGVLYTLSTLDWLRVCASEGVPLGFVQLEVHYMNDKDRLHDTTPGETHTESMGAAAASWVSGRRC